MTRQRPGRLCHSGRSTLTSLISAQQSCSSCRVNAKTCGAPPLSGTLGPCFSPCRWACFGKKFEGFIMNLGLSWVLFTTLGLGSSCRNLPPTCKTGWETSCLPPRPSWKNWIRQLRVWSNQSAGFCPAASCSCRGEHLERLKAWR